MKTLCIQFLKASSENLNKKRHLEKPASYPYFVLYDKNVNIFLQSPDNRLTTCDLFNLNHRLKLDITILKPSGNHTPVRGVYCIKTEETGVHSTRALFLCNSGGVWSPEVEGALLIWSERSSKNKKKRLQPITSLTELFLLTATRCFSASVAFAT
jgi:hypothetical protein